MSSTGVSRNIVILACAISAGIHGALVPEHFDEGAWPGLGFVAATVLLAALALTLTVRPTTGLAPAAATAVFAGLLVSYALATTTGFPLLHPDPEPVEDLALFTKAIEVVGLLAALQLFAGGRRAVVATFRQPKGTWT